MLAYGIAIVLIGIAGWFLAIALGFTLPYDYTLESLIWLKGNPWESSVLAILVIILGILILARPKPDNESFPTVSKWGDVRVSGQAIRDIVAQSAANLPEVRSVMPVLRQREGGVEILINCQMIPESLITDLSSQLQEQVKQDVERYTGIRVAEVKVLVRGIDGVSRAARVR